MESTTHITASAKKKHERSCSSECPRLDAERLPRRQSSRARG